MASLLGEIGTGSLAGALAPGAMVELRGAMWRVRRVEREKGDRFLHCVGASGIVKGKDAIFIERYEPNLRVLSPVEVALEVDRSHAFADTRLFLEAAFRSTPPSGSTPLTIGRAAIDDLPFQHVPVRRALEQSRVRLLIADDVGLGKTLEAGLTGRAFEAHLRPHLPPQGAGNFTRWPRTVVGGFFCAVF